MTAVAMTERDIVQPGGERLRVREMGAGRPVLFLHGFEGQPEDSGFLGGLATGARIIAPDHPGFDESDDHHGIEDITDLALLYRSVIDEVAGGPVDIIGHSMGGMIAAEVAALSPHLVRKLVLLNPFGLWVEDTPTPDIFVMTPGELKRATWAVQPDSGNGAKPAPPDKAAMIRRYRNLGAASRYLWPIPDRGFRKRARYVEAPALVLFGGADAVVPPSYASAWKGSLPHARVDIVEGGGHMLPFERPDVVARIVSGFLEE